MQLLNYYSGDKMGFMKEFLVLLAIFSVLGSAAAVSAADMYDNQGVYGDRGYSDGYAKQLPECGGLAGNQYNESAEEITDRQELILTMLTWDQSLSEFTLKNHI